MYILQYLELKPLTWVTHYIENNHIFITDRITNEKLLSASWLNIYYNFVLAHMGKKGAYRNLSFFEGYLLLSLVLHTVQYETSLWKFHEI